MIIDILKQWLKTTFDSEVEAAYYLLSVCNVRAQIMIN